MLQSEEKKKKMRNHERQHTSPSSTLDYTILVLFVFPKLLCIMLLFWNNCQPHTSEMCRAWFIIFFVAQSKGKTSKIGDVNGCLLRTSVMAFRFQLNKCEYATIAKHEELFSQTLKLFTTSPIFSFLPSSHVLFSRMQFANISHFFIRKHSWDFTDILK